MKVTRTRFSLERHPIMEDNIDKEELSEYDDCNGDAVILNERNKDP